jgi:hypothetical protein
MSTLGLQTPTPFFYTHIVQEAIATWPDNPPAIFRGRYTYHRDDVLPLGMFVEDFEKKVNEWEVLSWKQGLRCARFVNRFFHVFVFHYNVLFSWSLSLSLSWFLLFVFHAHADVQSINLANCPRYLAICPWRDNPVNGHTYQYKYHDSSRRHFKKLVYPG